MYGIVKQNDGSIKVYSEPGKGTTIKIYLPCYSGQTIENGKEGVRETARGSGETVLLVEDDASILQLTKIMLKNLGYNVLAAKTPAEAFQLAEMHSGTISLLITDVVMPGMNGRELVERLRFHYPELKCLFMSGYTADVIAHRGILEQRVNFISKPFCKMDLAVKVKEAMESACPV